MRGCRQTIMENTEKIICTVDELGRVFIPYTIRKQLGIYEGAKVEVSVSNDAVCFKKCLNIPSRGDVSVETLTKALYNTLHLPALFTDRTRVVASESVKGTAKYWDYGLSNKCELALRAETTWFCGNDDEPLRPFAFGNTDEEVLVIRPIHICNEVCGSIIVLKGENGADKTKEEILSAVEMAAGLFEASRERYNV